MRDVTVLEKREGGDPFCSLLFFSYSSSFFFFFVCVRSSRRGRAGSTWQGKGEGRKISSKVVIEKGGKRPQLEDERRKEGGGGRTPAVYPRREIIPCSQLSRTSGSISSSTRPRSQAEDTFPKEPNFDVLTAEEFSVSASLKIRKQNIVTRGSEILTSSGSQIRRH